MTMTDAPAFPHAVKATLHEACLQLALRCDGAHDADGQGFNATDASVGRRLAAMPPALWTDEMVGPVATMLVKYRAQLVDYGVDVEPIKALVPKDPTDRLRAGQVRTLTLDPTGRFICFTFAFNERISNAVRALPGRTWDRDAKQWRVSLAHRDRCIEVAQRHDFVIDPAVILAAAPEPERGTVTIDEGELLLRFPKDYAAIDRVRALPSRRFDPAVPGWRVPLHLVRLVRAAAEDFGWDVASDVDELDDMDPAETPVEVTEWEGRIVVRFPYHAELVALVRSIAGAKWSDGNRGVPRGWVMPVERAFDLLTLLEGSKVKLTATTELVAQAQAMIARIEASRALDSDFTIDGIAEGMELRPFQRAGVAYAIDSRRTFIADEMGLGKTPQGLVTLRATGAFPAAVLVPEQVKINWQREAHKWFPDLRVALLYGVPEPDLARVAARRLGSPSPALVPDEIAPGAFVTIRLDGYGDVERAAQLLPTADLVVVNYDIIGPTVPTGDEMDRNVLPKPGWTPVLKALRLVGIVADESHYLKNPKALRTRAAIEIANALGLDAVKLCLTGTAVENRRSEVASQLDFMGRLEEFGGRAAVTKMPDLARRLRSRCMVRRMKKDVAPELPPREHALNVVPLSRLDAKAMKDYRLAEDDLLTFIAQRAASLAAAAGLDPHDAAVKAMTKARGAEFLIRINELRRLATEAKLHQSIRWIRDFLADDPDKKLLVFANNHFVLDAVVKEFGCPLIKGGVSSAKRMEIVDDFQTNPATRVVALQMKAGGVGLTMTAASDVLFIQQAWSPAQHDQAIDRCYGRLNDMHGAVGWYMLAEGTIDEWVGELLEAKRVEIHDALDGDIKEGLIDPDGDNVEAGGSIYSDLVEKLTEIAIAR